MNQICCQTKILDVETTHMGYYTFKFPRNDHEIRDI